MMIPIHLCSSGQRFKQTCNEKCFKTRLEKSFGGHKHRYMHRAIDNDHKKQYVYVKTVKFLNQHFQIALEMVRNTLREKCP